MKVLIFIMLYIPSLLCGQTIVPLTDNMEPASGSNIKITGGEYAMNDPDENGLIRIIDKENITIDGADVSVTGVDFKGYLVYIENSTNITLKNFDRISNFYYCVRAKNSNNLTITDNDFSYNKKDTVGWIFIWTGVEEALGGGVLLDQCTDSELSGNLMTQQNDGIAMYGCDHVLIHNNTLNWNCGFGIRMNYTNHCNIHHNDCSHVNRLTDPSDCAAILLIVSNDNTVEYNDLTYSGDGVFLGQYEHSDIPNNNYFAYNDCSYSPHNGIEATFADGNVYVNNICNYSHYGFWLGYSFNSLVDGNEMIGNLQSGVAVDRGFENTFRNNTVKNNPVGFELWEGGVIGPYGDQYSHDYNIHNNILEGNTYAIQAKSTEHLVVKENTFTNNYEDIYFEGESFNDTITNNHFSRPIWFFMENRSDDQIYAPNNSFVPNDDFRIRTKLTGDILWNPYQQGDPAIFMTQQACDMAEPGAEWQIYADPYWGYRKTETLTWDETDKKVGNASLKLLTDRGFDVALTYRPGGDTTALWKISEDDTLFMWIKTIKNPSYGFQYFHVRIGSYTQGYYKYTANESLLNNAHNRWRQLKIPVKGNSIYHRTEEGFVNLDEISYVEVHADTWDAGFTLWLDGVQFHNCDPLTGVDTGDWNPQSNMVLYPNPTTDEVVITIQPLRSDCSLLIVDCFGKEMRRVEAHAGADSLIVNVADLPSGMYFVRMNGEVGRFVKR